MMFDPKSYKPEPDFLANRVILVTGASRGIGRAVAVACAKHGATVVLNGRNMDLLNAVYDEICQAALAEPVLLPLDLATSGTREYVHAAGLIGQQLHRLDGIVHCASHLEKLSALETQSIEEWERMLRVNLIAPFAINQGCVRLLRASGDASVIVTSESHASSPAAFWGGYAVSKSGLETMVRIQADEWSRDGDPRINIVVPGPVASPLRSKTHPGELTDDLPSPDILISTYLYLLGAESRGLNGATLRIQS